jgi:hypothetical protein
MVDIKNLRSEADLVYAYVGSSQAYVDTIAGREDEPAMVGYAEYGVPWYSAACQGQAGLQDIAAYRALVENVHCSAWMDNTTIVTACALMSDEGPNVMTPLTVWDLVTFIRAVVCYERIYHHEHPDIDDERVNELLGGTVLKSVSLPIRAIEGGSILPDPWDGAHRLMCETWEESWGWLKRLHESVGSETLDGKNIQVVTEAWRAALGNADLQPTELVDFREVDKSWTSPSNQLLVETANVTSVDDTLMYLDPTEGFQKQSKRMRELGIYDVSQERRRQILSELNLRAYINQRIAEFFALPYACSAGRLPFRDHLHDRSLKVQQELVVAKVIDNRYAELGQSVKLRLPIFLSLALHSSITPEGLWFAIAELREEATKFRAHREGLDQALAGGDLKEFKKIGKALNTTVDNLLELAGKATTAAGAVVLENLAKGDIAPLGTGIGAAVAAAKGLFKSSFTERLMWRLRSPQLLWMNNLIDQSLHLTESMPDFSRIWEIPPNRQAIFAERFQRMAVLAS